MYSIVIVLLINPHMQAYFLVKVGLSRVRINPHMQGYNMTKLRHICQGSLISRPYQFSSSDGRSCTMFLFIFLLLSELLSFCTFDILLPVFFKCKHL